MRRWRTTGLLLIVTVTLTFPSHGVKPQLPISVEVELADPLDSDAPLVLLSQVSSSIQFSDGVISLELVRLPLTNAPSITKLWSGNGDSGFVHSVEHQLPKLLPGKYRIRVIFELGPDQNSTEEIHIGQNLYLEVGVSEVFASPISFSQLERIKLKKDLDRRAKADSTTSNLKANNRLSTKDLEAVNRNEKLEKFMIEDQSKRDDFDKSDSSSSIKPYPENLSKQTSKTTGQYEGLKHEVIKGSAPESNSSVKDQAWANGKLEPGAPDSDKQPAKPFPRKTIPEELGHQQR